MLSQWLKLSRPMQNMEKQRTSFWAAAKRLSKNLRTCQLLEPKIPPASGHLRRDQDFSLRSKRQGRQECHPEAQRGIFMILS